MPELPRQIPLAGGDYFMHSQDARMRDAGLPGNICRVALRLDGGLDPEALRRRIESSPVFGWLARMHITRPWQVAPPTWRATASPRAFFQVHPPNGSHGEVLGAVPREIGQREMHAARGPSLAIDLVGHSNGSQDLILSWNHALLDARGAEFILRHLYSGPAPDDSSTLESLINPDQTSFGFSKWWNSLGRARLSLNWLKASGKPPLFSLMPEAAPASAPKNHSRLLLFTSEEAARIDARCKSLNAAFRRSHFYLAASLRAVHEVALRRGKADSAYLLPVPHDKRRRGAKGPIFSNHLSILFYRIEAHQATNLSAVIEELTKQMMEQIRTQFPECCMAALDMFKPLPLNLYLYQLGKPSQGKFASFCFSDSGETCAGIRDVMGAKIQSVVHMVSTWRPPGLTVLFWSYAGRPCAQLSYTDDCLSPEEADLLERTLRSALVEEIPT